MYKTNLKLKYFFDHLTNLFPQKALKKKKKSSGDMNFLEAFLGAVSWRTTLDLFKIPAAK